MRNDISSVMRSYFDEPASRMLTEAFVQAAPITPRKKEWRQVADGSALIRDFDFKSRYAIRMFVNDVLQLQEELQHSAQILIADDRLSVKIRVGTKVLSRVTEIDIEYARNVDDIYQDWCDAHKENDGNQRPDDV